MLAFILRRLLLMVPTTLGIALVIFLYPGAGDPALAVGDQSNASMGAGGDDESRYDKFCRSNGLTGASWSSSSTTSARST